MSNGNGSTIWRTIALMAVSALGGGISTAYSIGHSTVTRSDVHDMIAIESPYVQDKNDIYNRLEELRNGQEETNKKLDAVIEALSTRHP